ncbi:Flagellar hook-associated protein FlgK [hydrothermal vent metagenome]|uniref:Flagellar hook-associated protein FlgK n=1 Tax=hydrothermal vent metagenome TaxID=652676 RepID=A0A3B1B380_9ZZZZ
MAGGDLLGISTSGVQAAQRALSTVGHNIANSSTPGYSRQRTDLDTRTPQFAGNGAIGTGVVVNSVDRYYDEFLTSEVRHTNSLSKFLNKSYEFTTQVDNMLADPEAGLAPALSEFFDSVNGLANDPTSNASRQVLLSTSRNLSDRFAFLNERFESLRKGVNQDMRGVVGQVNQIAKGIAQLNNTIVRAREVTDKPANDLLDQRDRLVKELSSLINVRTTIQDDGRLNVFIGNGQTLVIADVYEELGVALNEFDPSQTDVTFKGSGAEIVINQYLSGGELGGMIKFRKEILDPAQNELGRIAIGITQSFNNQHRLGMTMNNELGGNYFRPIDLNAALVLPSSNNQGDLKIDSEVVDTNKLTTSNYQLLYQNGQYELLRLDDAKVVGKFTSLPHEVETDGFKLILDGGAIKDGDRYIIQPTRRSADIFSVAINTVDEIAASSPIRVEADINNLGDAGIEITQITDVDNTFFSGEPGKLSPPYIIRFIDENNFEILDNSGNAIAIKQAATADDPAIDLNQSREQGAEEIVSEKETKVKHDRDDKHNIAGGLSQLESTIAYDPHAGTTIFPTPGGVDRGMHIRIDGKPKTGDMFRIEFNKDGISDNKNALALAALQTKPTLLNGTSDYAQTYGQLVSRVGSRTHELDINRQAQKLLLDQAIESREEVSGVNLDEEAAEMIRYQNMYQANAQVIAAANQTFQVLMDAFR